MRLRKFRAAVTVFLSVGAIAFNAFQTAILSAAEHAAPKDPTVAAIHLIRARAELLRKSPRTQARQTAATLEIATRIMAAKTRAERTAAVAQLPVTVVRTPLDNGDLLKQFVVRGKVVRQTVVLTAEPEPRSHQGGPSSPPSDCFEEAPEPCLTEQEEEEWEIELAAATAEADAVAADTAVLDAFMVDFCMMNPYAPACNATQTPDGDMSAPHCWNELQAAISDGQDAVVGVLGKVISQEAAKKMGKKAGKALVISARVTMWGTIAVGALSLGFLGACVVAQYVGDATQIAERPDQLFPTAMWKPDEAWITLLGR